MVPLLRSFITLGSGCLVTVKLIGITLKPIGNNMDKEEANELWYEIYRSQLMIQALINALNKFIRPEVLLEEKDIAFVEKTAVKLFRKKTEQPEKKDAPEERFLKDCHLPEYPNRNARREATKTSCGDSNECSGKVT